MIYVDTKNDKNRIALPPGHSIMRAWLKDKGSRQKPSNPLLPLCPRWSWMVSYQFFRSRLKEFGLTRVGRITGLDPAGPIFRDAHVACRLDKEDADYVQIIHSNAGHSVKGAMGIDRQIGHRDCTSKRFQQTYRKEQSCQIRTLSQKTFLFIYCLIFPFILPFFSQLFH